MNKNLKIMIATALGIALFVVLTLCLQVPVFENYYLCLGYIAMAVYLYSFGTVSGTIVGVLGTVLYCLLTSGLRGMPGWAAGNVFIGVGLGLTFLLTKRLKNRWLRYGIWVVSVVVFVAIGILGVKSLIDSLIRTQPFLVRAAMNLYAFVADAAVLIIALPLCEILDRPAQKLLREKQAAANERANKADPDSAGQAVTSVSDSALCQNDCLPHVQSAANAAADESTDKTAAEPVVKITNANSTPEEKQVQAAAVQ